MSNKNEKCCKKTKIGGQALIEGIMMKGVSKGAMAVRMKEGGIDVEEWDLKPQKWYNKAPFIRGSINFVSSLSEGYSCMMKSAEKSGMLDEEENEEPSKFEKWLDEKLGDKLTGVIMAIAMVIGVALAILLFAVVPTALFDWIETLMPLVPDAATSELVPMDISMWQSTFEGVMRMILFVGYMAVVAQMKDIRRTYEYHGAEHKTIACYEAGEELTVENIKKHTRFHPRCGTSFIILSLLVSILVYTIVPINPTEWWGFEGILAVLVRVGLKLVLLPFVVGIAYELIRIAGRHSNIFTRIISAPGLWMQRLTTREPDASQIEIAIAAISPVLPKEGENDEW
ncbi:MAG: DUF1385 domain-containing protein [Ruminococcaceae bacterium]|nr:DUF1385 domain-containing protein [Oscillospiraceae bacterium]